MSHTMTHSTPHALLAPRNGVLPHVLGHPGNLQGKDLKSKARRHSEIKCYDDDVLPPDDGGPPNSDEVLASKPG
jgi:hypothetical protein